MKKRMILMLVIVAVFIATIAAVKTRQIQAGMKQQAAFQPPPEAPPEGFEKHDRRSPLTDPWEPIYSKQTPDAIILGLRLATPHTNARGFVHGGLIAALTDKAMGHSCGHKMRGAAQSLVTVSMAIDFVSSAQIGQWLTVETEVVKTSSTICFALRSASAMRSGRSRMMSLERGKPLR